MKDGSLVNGISGPERDQQHTAPCALRRGGRDDRVQGHHIAVAMCALLSSTHASQCVHVSVCFNAGVYVVCQCSTLYLQHVLSDQGKSSSFPPQWWALCCLCSHPEDLLTPQLSLYLITTTHTAVTADRLSQRCGPVRITV